MKSNNFNKIKTITLIIALLLSLALCGCNNSENEESSNTSDDTSYSVTSKHTAEIQVSIGADTSTESDVPLVSVPTNEERLESDIIESSKLLEGVTKLGSKADSLFKVLNNGVFTIQLNENLFGDKKSYFITCDNDKYYININGYNEMLYINGKSYVILSDDKCIVDIDDDNGIIRPIDLIPDYNGYTFKCAKEEEYNGARYYCETYVTNDALYTDDTRTELGVKEVGELKIYFDNDIPVTMVYTYADYDDVSTIEISNFSDKADISYFKLPNFKHISVAEYESR